MAGTKGTRAPRRTNKGATGTRSTATSSRSRGHSADAANWLPRLALAVVLAVGAMLFIPVLVENTDPVLSAAREALQQQFGVGRYLAPLLLVGVAALLFASLRRSGYALHWSRVVGWLAFFVGVLGLLHWWGQLWSPVPANGGLGGYLGEQIVGLLEAPFGVAGAVILLLGLAAAGAAAGFGIQVQSLRPLLRGIGRSLAGSYRFLYKKGGPGLWRFTRRTGYVLAGASTSVRRHLNGIVHSVQGLTRRASQSLSRPREPEVGERLQPSVAAVATGSTNGETRVRITKAPPAGSAASPAPVSRSPILPNPSGDGWQLPPLDLLENGPEPDTSPLADEERAKAIEKTIEKAFEDFGVPVKVVDRRPGPTVTQFGVEPLFHEKRARDGTVLRREKVKVREITARSNDLALALAARSIRIEAPVPGRPVVGIEVPNQSTSMVSLRSELEHKVFQRARAKYALPIVLGRDVSGDVVTADLAKMPHLLIAGATGSGKSVCINSIIATLLMNHNPDGLRFLMIDPKRVELTMFDAIPHLLRPVVVDVDKAVPTLFQAVAEMDRRYRDFAAAGVRNIEGFNRLAERDPERSPIPYLVLVIDELADLMMLAPDEVERTICRLAQLARATGIHLVVATQRPSVDVVTGLIKANFPTRISFMVTSQVDSRTILDTPGAEKLLGRGDMLFLPSDAPKPIRLQGTYLSDEETEAITRFWRAQRSAQYAKEFIDLPEWSPGGGDADDELYDRAVELAHEHDSISASFLQRKLRVGWNRAARLMEMLEENGELNPTDRDSDSGVHGDHDLFEEPN